MTAESYHVTDAELAILETIWDRGPSTIRELTEARYPERTSSDYATVQKLLERLESKGYVVRDRSSFAHVFRSAVARDQLVGRELRAIASKLCEGSMTPLLMHLARNRKLSRDEREELRRLLDETPVEEGGPDS